MAKKPNRHDLIGIDIEILKRDGRNGTFKVTVINDTASKQRHAVGLESNVPLRFLHDGKIINFKKRPSRFAETEVKTIPPSSTVPFMFHWTDPDDEFKSIVLRSKFMNSTSDDDEIL